MSLSSDRSNIHSNVLLRPVFPFLGASNAQINLRFFNNCSLKSTLLKQSVSILKPEGVELSQYSNGVFEPVSLSSKIASIKAGSVMIASKGF